MLVKAQRMPADRRLRSGHERGGLWDAEVAESMLMLLLKRRREARARMQRQHPRLPTRQREQEPRLPQIIATGPERTVWIKSAQQDAGHVVYRDAEAPQRLLHVIPEEEDQDKNRNVPLTTTTYPPQQATTQPTMFQQSYIAKGLRRPAPLGYVGMPLPVAPSLPSRDQKVVRYLVRPCFPKVV